MAAKKTSSAPKTVEIPALNLRRMVITIKGETPLIVNRFSEEKMQAIEDAQVKKAKNTKPPRKPEEEFQQARHIRKDGRDGFPSIGIKRAIVTAGGRFTEAHMTVLRGVITITGDYLIPIEGPEPEMRRDPVVLANGGTSVAYRPAYNEWQLRVPVLYNADMLTEAQLINLFKLAGASVGLGAWRIEKNGVAGAFDVVGAELFD